MIDSDVALKDMKKLVDSVPVAQQGRLSQGIMQLAQECLAQYCLLNDILQSSYSDPGDFNLNDPRR